ncbi:hypothetical protein NLG97_g1349 [Lecanicillium saksenae]|uniref:Uncharacterized protein n=1 Tax=Lecanicillium saksenae TaxID=468837 RepID=A0ACC1R7A1_9HYPO|nr:hypothetical protein NLG97_g1349 [Lecanicillium saksenae]
MKLLTLLLSCLLAMLLPGASAKKGGGGSGDGNSNSDSHGGGGGGGSSGGSSSGDSSGGSSSGDEGCGIADPPPIWKWDLLPSHAKNNTGMKGVGRAYGGSFFKGEASVSYIVTASKRCRMDNFRSTHMLGYAWIGPQPSYPTGPTNPIIIGFKAWETGLSLENIGDSYAYIKKDQFCPRQPDLFRVETSHGWTDFTARTTRAADFMNMTLANSAVNSNQVLFNATMKEELGFKPTDEGLLLELPRGACSGSGDYKFALPDQLTMNGSFTNTTLNLTLSGRGNATGRGLRDAEVTAEFEITFTGVFDSDNSTHKISVKPQGEPLVAWVQSSGFSETAIRWSSRVVFFAAALLLI